MDKDNEPMKYISTRGECAPHSFSEAVMAGLAPDGGLFLPESLPDFSGSLARWRALPFPELFQAVVTPFLDDAVSPEALAGMTGKAYAVFSDPDVIPVREVGGVFVCELIHGPTLAFKDIALQFLGQLFEHLLHGKDAALTIVGATSGDTGAAAIHALRGREGVEVFILFPKGRISPMQELQMTTVPDANIHAVAVEGSFDDTQALLKSLFSDREFNARYSLGAVNSINWARVLAQTTYYFYAYFRVLDALEHPRGEARPMKLGDPVCFSVPTGNFGHIYAGKLAKAMGLPVDKLVLATNANGILCELVRSGNYRKGEVHRTLSPSMDIQVASNFERYLFDLSGRDGKWVRRWLGELEEKGGFTLDGELLTRVQSDFAAARVDDEETLRTIREVHEQTGYLLDPHSATGYRAGQDYARNHGQDGVPMPNGVSMQNGVPMIAMATAHPAKFSGAIRQAIGHEPPLPPGLALLKDLPTRVEVLPSSLPKLQDYIRRTLKGAAHP